MASVPAKTRTDHRLNQHMRKRSIMRNGIFHLVTGTALAIALSASSAYAQKKYDTGATDTEIKIGQTNPFSGPAPPMPPSARRRPPISR
jgi:hypothetical protein